MNILSIETSCDETAVAILSNRTLRASLIASQIDLFKSYGGVVPELAARSHLEAILPLLHQTFQTAGFIKPANSAAVSPNLADFSPDWSQIDAIAVTHTPGLIGSLLIGTLTARTLALIHRKPLYPTHHLKSHLYSVWLQSPKTEQKPNKPQILTANRAPHFPILALIISGGHTQLIRMTDHNNFQIIGTTRDDAVGECFDKIAKILGLPYPGGPAISAAALGQLPKNQLKETPIKGDPHRYRFPHPKVDGLDFSFSGLKTAVLRRVQAELQLPLSHPSSDLKNHISLQQIANFAASFEQTAVDILVEKLSAAYSLYPDTADIIIAGGVSANSVLRRSILQRFPHAFFPEPKFSGDNAAMVAIAAHFSILADQTPTDPYSLNILPRSPIN